VTTGFNLSSVFATVAAAVPEQEVLVHGDLRLTYAQVQAHADGFARFLASGGLGCHTERDDLAGHESGQDHVGLYLYNGPEYLEAMIASYRARAVPINVNYRYVAEELAYLLVDAGTRALVYHSCFAEQVAAVRAQVPTLDVLVQVPDESGADLLPGAVWWEDAVATPGWAGPRMWVHGDLHPANVVIADGTLAGVVDFGALFAGDPAVDLAAAWVVLPAGMAEHFFFAYRAVDEATMRRARGLALLKSLFLMLMGQNGDRGLPGGKPAWGPAGREALDRVLNHE